MYLVLSSKLREVLGKKLCMVLISNFLSNRTKINITENRDLRNTYRFRQNRII